MAAGEPDRRVFGDFALSLRPLALERDGAPVALRHQALKLLDLLTSRAGDFVSHADIRAHVWGDRHVDHARGTHLLIREIRQALGDDADNPTFIETLPRQGYRFTGAATDTARISPNVEKPTLRHALSRRAAGLAVVIIVGMAAWGVAPKGVEAVSPAREAYLKGAYLIDNGARDDLDKAAAYFEDAIAADASFAPARAGLAEIAVLRGDFDSAETHARAALARDPALAEGHMHLAMVAALRDWDWPAAQRAIDKALSLDPKLPKAYGAEAMLEIILGRTDAALAASARAYAIDPVSALIVADQGWFHYYAGNYAAARKYCAEAKTIGPARSAAADWCLFKSALLQSDANEAAGAAARIVEVNGGPAALAASLRDDKNAESLRAFLQWRLGWIKSLIDRNKASASSLALAYADLGDMDAAADALIKAAQDHAPMAPFVLRDPVLVPLHDDPRYRAALRLAGLADDNTM